MFRVPLITAAYFYAGLSKLLFLHPYCRGMKARLAATYPDAFPDGAMAEAMDQRPDLESPLN
jgi:hypothetical protein